jgi:hypothetical protein
MGAGASFGHLELPNEDTPPLLSNFLSRSVKKGVLNHSDFPELVDECLSQGEDNDLNTACLNMEKKHFNFESFLSKTNDLWTLQLSRFFIYKFLGNYCKLGINKNSAYQILADFMRKKIYSINGVINLNYDTLFESALISNGIQVNYSLNYNLVDKFFVLKPHGSVNFRFPLSRGFIKMNVGDWQEFLKMHNSIIETNRFSGQWIETYDPTFNFETDFLTNTLDKKDRILNYIPALIPPLGEKKYYEQFDSYEIIWDSISSILMQTNTLVIIGCNMNKEDTRLWEVINNNLSKDSKIKIISSSYTSADKIGKQLNSQGFKEVFPSETTGFYDYAKQLLETGNI